MVPCGIQRRPHDGTLRQPRGSRTGSPGRRRDSAHGAARRLAGRWPASFTWPSSTRSSAAPGRAAAHQRDRPGRPHDSGDNGRPNRAHTQVPNAHASKRPRDGPRGCRDGRGQASAGAQSAPNRAPATLASGSHAAVHLSHLPSPATGGPQLLLVVHLSSERTHEPARQDSSFAEKQECHPARLLVVQVGSQARRPRPLPLTEAKQWPRPAFGDKRSRPRRAGQDLRSLSDGDPSSVRRRWIKRRSAPSGVSASARRSASRACLARPRRRSRSARVACR